MGFEFKSHRKSINQKLDQAMALMLNEWGDVAQGFATKDVPVDTGNLKGKIDYRVDLDNNRMIIGTNVEYAPRVEFDEKAHHTVGKAHFLRDSIALHRGVYQMIAKKYLGDMK